MCCLTAGFSNPKQILDVKELGLNVIAMVKRSSKRNYIFEGKHMNIKKIFSLARSDVVALNIFFLFQ